MPGVFRLRRGPHCRSGLTTTATSSATASGGGTTASSSPSSWPVRLQTKAPARLSIAAAAEHGARRPAGLLHAGGMRDLPPAGLRLPQVSSNRLRRSLWRRRRRAAELAESCVQRRHVAARRDLRPAGPGGGVLLHGAHALLRPLPLLLHRVRCVRQRPPFGRPAAAPLLADPCTVVLTGREWSGSIYVRRGWPQMGGQAAAEGGPPPACRRHHQGVRSPRRVRRSGQLLGRAPVWGPVAAGRLAGRVLCTDWIAAACPRQPADSLQCQRLAAATGLTLTALVLVLVRVPVQSSLCLVCELVPYFCRHRQQSALEIGGAACCLVA